MGGELDTAQDRRLEVLRQAGIALDNRLVVLWEVSRHAELVPVLSSALPLADEDLGREVKAILGQRGNPIIEGDRWVGCRLDGAVRWCLAPVRTQPAAPPPEGDERRSRERITLELAGLCLGLLDRAPGAGRPRVPEPEALRELARHPSAIAHEVANPLAAALLSAELAGDAVRESEQLEPELRSRVLDELALMTKRTEQALQYLRSIQDSARGARARFERFDAVQVVRSCVTLERPLARRQRIGLKWETSVRSVYLNGDPNALYRLLTHLIRNAVDASEVRKEVVSVTSDVVGGKLSLSVRDRGVGIAPEHLDRVFEHGFTTKGFGAGAGMGLALAREIAETMFGGTVTVESAMGRGSVFTVALPLPPQRGGEAS